VTTEAGKGVRSHSGAGEGVRSPRDKGVRSIVEALAIVAALLLLAYRLCHLDLAPFILDEPIFLRAAASEVASGQWLSASPIRGTQGVTYGATVFWFYALVQTVFGAQPHASLLAMCLMVTVAHLALALALWDYFGRGRSLLGALIAWIAASPFQFFWARLAWDQSVDIAAAWTIVLLTRRTPFIATRAVALGLVLGLGVSSHLMVAPLFALTFVFLAWHLKRIAPVALTAATALLVNLPYLHFLLGEPRIPGPHHAFDLRWLGDYLIQPLRVSSLFKIDYFFDAQWSEFLGGHTVLMNAAIALSMLTLGGLTLLGLAFGLRDPRTRLLATFALALWLGTAAFHLVLGLDRQPHYAFASYWVIGFALAAALSGLGDRARVVAGTALALVFSLHAIFIVHWMSFVQAHRGTAGIHYGATVGAQTQLVREACAQGDTIRNTIAPFDISIEYIAAHDPSCVGKTVTVLHDRQ